MKNSETGPGERQDLEFPAPESRTERHADAIARAERSTPLRRRILELLAERALNPSAVADRLGVAKESVSRLLTPLQEEGLIVFRSQTDDRRRRLYALTAAGETELSRFRAYGANDESPRHPTAEERSDFLYSSLEAAVELRRKTNDLSGSAERMNVVLRQARRLGNGMLLIEALTELATTLRQIPNAADEEVHSVLAEIEEIALGKSEFAEPTLVLPAVAHRRYVLGRMGEDGGVDAARRGESLGSAANDYEQLRANPPYLTSAKWAERQAWSLLGLARTLRAQSDFERALGTATEALTLFGEIEDSYGLSHGLLLTGHCLRLMGEFEESWAWLNQAHELASHHSYERCEAESLLQLGEALRCQRHLPDAQAALEEARERAMRMGLVATQARAHSALGAVAFHCLNLDEAHRELLQATNRFHATKELEGLALATRRQAALARRASEQADSLDGASRLIATSFNYYEQLGIPAGLTACRIETGRLSLIRTGKADPIVAELLDLIDNLPAQRSILELDPWVPRVLVDFADETGNAHFIERCRHVLHGAERRLDKVASEGVRKAAEAFDPSNAHISKPAQREADEMGGEARQDCNEAPETILA